jgi:hypothetical protein
MVLIGYGYEIREGKAMRGLSVRDDCEMEPMTSHPPVVTSDV